MRWKVERLGVGGGTYDDIRLAEGGALECRNKVERNNSRGYVMMPVAYYGPGMWITATIIKDEE